VDDIHDLHCIFVHREYSDLSAAIVNALEEMVPGSEGVFDTLDGDLDAVSHLTL
jgi:hypothetical protein